MGIFSRASKLADFATSSAYSTEPVSQSPWSPLTFASVVFPSAGSSLSPVSVDEAMAIPAVSAAIGIYSGVASRFPLTGAEWLNKTTTPSATPQIRIATTVQDLIFHNASVWFVVRDADGYVSDAVRIHPNRWSLDDKGQVQIDGKPFPQDKVVYIGGLKPTGFLNAARNTVRHAAGLERTILNRSANPAPITAIRETTQNEATPEEVDQLIADYAEARKSDNGGVVYVPFGLEVEPYGASDDAGAMLIAARAAVRTDIANHLNISAAMVDGMTGNSQVYENAIQSKSELLELSIKLFTEPIADRLSQDDVTPPGVRVAFDYSSFESTGDASGNTPEETPID